MAAPHPVPRGHNPFQQRVSAGYDALPPQLRLVGQWVMDHPREVALLSTREQARRIAVPAATMTRFAQRLGFAGYDEVRRIHADNVRRLPVGFVGKAEAMVARQKKRGAAIVALTDSALAPIARLAKASVVVSTESPSFFHTMTPAFAAAEALAALLAADDGDDALSAIAAADRELLAVDAYVTPPRRRRPQ